MFNSTDKAKWLIFGAILLLIVAVYFVMTQTKPAIIKTVQVMLSVKPSVDFTLAVTPAYVESPINRTVAYIATVTSVNNFAGDIVFTISGLPAGFTVTMFPGNKLTLGPDAPKGIQINIDIGNNPALVGDYTITVKAESTIYN